MNPMVSDTVDLQSPDDIALADRMNVGRQQIVTELKKVIVGQDEVRVPGETVLNFRLDRAVMLYPDSSR